MDEETHLVLGYTSRDALDVHKIKCIIVEWKSFEAVRSGLGYVENEGMGESNTHKFAWTQVTLFATSLSPLGICSRFGWIETTSRPAVQVIR